MRTIRTPDGRSIALELYGQPDGVPVFWFHGIPSSRLGACVLDRQAASRGVQLIAPDRPGYGYSDPAPDRCVTDWPHDVCAIATELGLGKFSVLGVSGGFQYVAAAAHAIPDRIHRVGVVSAMGPLGAPGVLTGIDPRMRVVYELGLRHHRAARVWLSSFGRSDPARVAKRQMRLLHECDQELLGRPEQQQARIEDLSESARQGMRAAQDEGQRYLEEWPFQLECLDIPFHLWQGEFDKSHPPAMGRYLEATIPRSVMHWRPGVGGLFYLDDFGSVLDDLLG